jgi:hypothetical protein
VRKVLLDPFPNCRLAPQKGTANILINRVPVIRDENCSLPSEEALLHEITMNPTFEGVTLLAPPHWLCWDSEIELFARHASILLTVLDPDSSIVPRLIRSPPAFFGEHTKVALFKSRPFLHQCNHCWTLNHSTNCCPVKSSTPICPLCGGPHTHAQHAPLCPTLGNHATIDVCSCEPTCLNGARLQRKTKKGPDGKGHSALDPSCPLCAAYCLPPSTEDEVPVPPANPAPTSAAPPPATSPTVTAISRPKPRKVVNRPVNPIPIALVTSRAREMATRPIAIPSEELESLAPEDATFVTFERSVAKLP